MSKEIIVVDSQRLNMIQNCAYKYDLTFNKNLIPLRKSEPLEEGSLIHSMLETYYSMRKYSSRWPKDFTKAKMLKICERVGEHFASLMSLPVEDVDDTFRVFREYVEYYWGEPQQTLAVEQVGSKIMYEDEELIIVYETKIDWIWSLPQIKLMPTDHKHSRRRGPTHELSNQFMGYCWMLDVRNIMINKIGFQTSLTPAEKFQRPVISYSLPVLESWVRNSVWWIKFLNDCEKTQSWPQNFTSCDKYSGCIFSPVCLSPDESKAFKMKQLFNIAEEEWDVGARL